MEFSLLMALIQALCAEAQATWPARPVATHETRFFVAGVEMLRVCGSVPLLEAFRPMLAR